MSAEVAGSGDGGRCCAAPLTGGSLLAGAGALLAGCSGSSSYFSSIAAAAGAAAAAASRRRERRSAPARSRSALILPLSAAGNAGIAGQAMRNAADMALAEFNAPNIQLLVKDDGGTPEAARQAAQQALDEGAEIILGPLFAQSVSVVGQMARTRNIPVIAFSTDANVASPGVYLLSFLPETDVARIVQYAASTGKRSYAALIPDNPYGTVVEAAFQQDVARRGGQIVALEHYPHDKAAMAGAGQERRPGGGRADALFIPDGGDAVPDVAQMLVGNGVNTKKIQLLGTGLWDDPRISVVAGARRRLVRRARCRGLSQFRRPLPRRYKQQPVRTATLAYDAVALVAALVKTQGAQRFSPEVLTNPSGFSGIDGLFRFRADGTNERGLAVLVSPPSGAQVVVAARRTVSATAIGGF